MKFILDENIAKRLAFWLKNRKHEAITLHELNILGIQNGSIAEMAIKQNAIIITCDSDFLKLKKERQSKLRVIYFNLEIPDFKNITDILSKNLEDFLEFLKEPGAIQITELVINYLRF